MQIRLSPNPNLKSDKVLVNPGTAKQGNEEEVWTRGVWYDEELHAASLAPVGPHIYVRTP